MPNINLFERLNYLQGISNPLVTAQGGVVKVADQFFQPIQRTGVPNLFIGLQHHHPMQFQTYTNEWNEETQLFDIYGSYVSNNTIFFDYYASDYTGFDVSQNLKLLLPVSDYSGQQMDYYGCGDIIPIQDPTMLQGVLKQRWRFLAKFQFYDEILLSSAYKTDIITIAATAVIDGSGTSVAIDLSINLDE